MADPTTQAAVERIKKWSDDCEDAKTWGGPTMYPAFPLSRAEILAMAKEHTHQAERIKELEGELRRLTTFPMVTADELAGARDCLDSASDQLEHAGKREWADRCRRQADRNRAALLGIGRDVERVRGLLSTTRVTAQPLSQAEIDSIVADANLYHAMTQVARDNGFEDLTDAITEATKAERLMKALDGFADDYQTSENHHPNIRYG